MINQVMLVGRIITLEKEENQEIKKANIKIAVNRKYKNADGIYDTDFINCILWGNVATNVLEYCEEGDLIGIRGRLRQGVENSNLEVIVEQVTFLSSKQGLKNKEEHSCEHNEGDEENE